MAKLILKSPYIKNSGGASGYLKYIATRERVELLPDDRPPTRKQEQLVRKLAKDFPDTKSFYEYEDYLSKPTKVNASRFISLTLESNWDSVQQSEQYMKYIATRPRAERIGSHGLFSDDETVDLDATMRELEHYTGNVWTHIISLKREDAARLGFDNAAAWRDLLKTHRNDIAEAMKIPPNDFRWYAAFHDEGDHPHVHMMAWSDKPGQAYLSKDGIRQIKSVLTNDIFHNEMLHLYEQKSQSRDELVQQARKSMLELARAMEKGICDHPEAEQLVWELAQQLETVTGKKSYGYLPKPQKALVDKIVDQMERLPIVRECYENWLNLQGEVDSYYHDKPQERVPLSQQKEFQQIKNTIIREAENLRLGKVTFEDRAITGTDEPDEFTNAPFKYWEILENIRDESLELDDRTDAVDDMKRLAESGDPYAQYCIGKLYRDGDPLIPNSEFAKFALRDAAQQGLAAAQYALGKLYLSDDIEVHDPELGMQWLEQAAKNGHSFAAYLLGKEYLKGENTEKNTDKALDWYSRSAQQGNPYAQYMLGKMYLEGIGVEKDKSQGLYWLSESAKQGHPYASVAMERSNSTTPLSVFCAVNRILHHMSLIFRDNSLTRSQSGGIQIDRKRWAEMQDKRIALGHKEDDHPDYGPTM